MKFIVLVLQMFKKKNLIVLMCHTYTNVSIYDSLHFDQSLHCNLAVSTSDKWRIDEF